MKSWNNCMKIIIQIHIHLDICTVNVLKFQTLFSFVSQIKCWLLSLKFTKCLYEWQTGKTLIRLLLQKQSDLGLHCMSRPFWQTAVFPNFRTSNVPCILNFIISGKLHSYNPFSLRVAKTLQCFGNSEYNWLKHREKC